MLFKQHGNLFKIIPEKSIKLEKDIQIIIESNLEVFFGLKFVSSEFTIDHFRCDTLAFDKESQSFVVIEYKKQTDKGLFDQGLGYFELMASRQADFLMEYNEKTDKHLLKKDIDWQQSKIIFLSPSFNQSQIQAANFDINIELWKIRVYDQMIELNKISNSNKTPMPVKGSQAKIIEKFKSYTEEYHFTTRSSEKTRHLYEQFRDKIREFGEFQIIPRKQYIAFRRNINFVSFIFRKSKLHIYLGVNFEYDDPKKLIKNASEIGHWATGSSLITIDDDSDFDYILKLIHQSYEKSLNRTLSNIANDAVKTRKKNARIS